MSGTISMNGRKKLATLRREFTEKFPYLTLLFLDEQRHTLDAQRTLADVRTKRGEELSIRSSLKVQTLEARCLEQYGLIVEVAYSRNGLITPTPDTLDKTLGELNTWCASNGGDLLQGATAMTVQEELATAIRARYPEAVVK